MTINFNPAKKKIRSERGGTDQNEGQLLKNPLSRKNFMDGAKICPA
jgi:hypothetical protein